MRSSSERPGGQQAPEQACGTVHGAVSVGSAAGWGTRGNLFAGQQVTWLGKVLPSAWLEGQGKERRNYKQERTLKEEEDKERLES